MTALVKSLPQTLAALAILAVIGTLGATSHLSSTQVNTMLLAVIGAIGVSGALVLGSPSPNVNALPHLILAVFVLGLVVALSLQNVLDNGQVFGMIGAITGGGLFAGGSTVNTNPIPSPVPTTVGNLGSPLP